MLLFNVQERLQVDIYLHFNTSNVTIQQDKDLPHPEELSISIHLMLLFNLNSASVTALAAIISIHLMLLFNGLFPGLPIHILLNFNTSNVTIQLPTGHKPCVFYLISIHLMLLFNQVAYIIISLCLIISIHLMLLFNTLRD